MVGKVWFGRCSWDLKGCHGGLINQVITVWRLRFFKSFTLVLDISRICSLFVSVSLIAVSI